MEETKLKSPKVTFRIPAHELRTVDKLVKKEFYQSRSELILKAVEKLLEEHNQRGEP
jgi:Arc/MetJ-type ribon-helix-helix transcriptional regulator